MLGTWFQVRGFDGHATAARTLSGPFASLDPAEEKLNYLEARTVECSHFSMQFKVIGWMKGGVSGPSSAPPLSLPKKSACIESQVG